jgi:hypothetical protein
VNCVGIQTSTVNFVTPSGYDGSTQVAATSSSCTGAWYWGGVTATCSGVDPHLLSATFKQVQPKVVNARFSGGSADNIFQMSRIHAHRRRPHRSR